MVKIMFIRRKKINGYIHTLLFNGRGSPCIGNIQNIKSSSAPVNDFFISQQRLWKLIRDNQLRTIQ